MDHINTQFDIWLHLCSQLTAHYSFFQNTAILLMEVKNELFNLCDKQCDKFTEK